MDAHASLLDSEKPALQKKQVLISDGRLSKWANLFDYLAEKATTIADEQTCNIEWPREEQQIAWQIPK